MHRERIQALITYLEDLSKAETEAVMGFNMNVYVFAGTTSAGYMDKSGHNCGTVGCIAGHTALLGRLFTPEMIEPEMDTTEVFRFARDYLELGNEESQNLFMPQHPVEWGKVTPQHAVRVLKKLLETGEVCWSIVPECYKDGWLDSVTRYSDDPHSYDI